MVDPFDDFTDPIFDNDNSLCAFTMNSDKRYEEKNTYMQPIIFPYSQKNRRKFLQTDDVFLLMALKQYGTSNLNHVINYNLIRSNWLPHKSHQEIKHRYKNTTSKRAPANILKRWKH